MSKPIVNVAIALLFHHSKVLVGWREAKQHQGNKYEFPGGKIEADETPKDACRREIYEEVGIDIEQWFVFDKIEHEYEDIIVKLHLFHSYVTLEQLELIHQPWAWFERDALSELNFPKANDVIIQRLIWPHQIKINEHQASMYSISADQFLYLRIDESDEKIEAIQLIDDEYKRCLILNIDIWQKLPKLEQNKIAAIHIKHHQLLSMNEDDLPKGIRVIAACHDQNTVDHAQNIGCDAIFVSPILETPSHEDTKGMGWDHFKFLVKDCHIPVFALGGLKPDDLSIAQQCGAYGVAGIQNF